MEAFSRSAREAMELHRLHKQGCHGRPAYPQGIDLRPPFRRVRCNRGSPIVTAGPSAAAAGDATPIGEEFREGLHVMNAQILALFAIILFPAALSRAAEPLLPDIPTKTFEITAYGG